MKKTKSVFSRPSGKTSPRPHLDWHPATYEEAADFLRRFNYQELLPGLTPQRTAIVYDYLARAAVMVGGLECPAPVGDPTGQFQASLRGNLLVMMRRENMPVASWEIYPPWLEANPELRTQLAAQ